MKEGSLSFAMEDVLARSDMFRRPCRVGNAEILATNARGCLGAWDGQVRRMSRVFQKYRPVTWSSSEQICDRGERLT
jgi:hypothetical protein